MENHHVFFAVNQRKSTIETAHVQSFFCMFTGGYRFQERLNISKKLPPSPMPSELLRAASYARRRRGSRWMADVMALSPGEIVSIYLPTYLSTYLPTYLSTYLPTYLPIYLPTYLSIYLSIYLPSLSIYLSICIYIYTSIYIYTI